MEPDRVALLHGYPVPRALEAFRAGVADHLQTAQPMAEQLLKRGIAHVAAAMGEPGGHLSYTSFVVTPLRARRDPRSAGRPSLP